MALTPLGGWVRGKLSQGYKLNYRNVGGLPKYGIQGHGIYTIIFLYFNLYHTHNTLIAAATVGVYLWLEGSVLLNSIWITVMPSLWQSEK